MEQVEKPLVSICTAVYNHEPFLRECFEGFIMQKTNFAFEVLVHDDASTDGSTNIIREYTAKYPHIFKPIYQQENQYSRGVKVSLKYQYSRAQGKYIALCEGDDYWTDPLKLQKQVDFLEANPEYVMCSHVCNKYIQLTQKFEEGTNGEWSNRTYSIEDIALGEWPFQTATIVYLRKALDLDYYNTFSMSMDVVLFYLLLKEGLGYSMADNMSVYRVHQGGTWSGIHYNQQKYIYFKVRLSIYDRERTVTAAKLVISSYRHALKRSFLLFSLTTFFRTINIGLRHFGLKRSMAFFYNRIVKGKYLPITSY